MKKIKILWSIILIITTSFICSPSKSIAESYYSENEPDNAAGSLKANDEGMLISPRYNCDPKMLIQGNPDIDPKFLLELLPKK